MERRELEGERGPEAGRWAHAIGMGGSGWAEGRSSALLKVTCTRDTREDQENLEIKRNG